MHQYGMLTSYAPANLNFANPYNAAAAAAYPSAAVAAAAASNVVGANPYDPQSYAAHFTQNYCGISPMQRPELPKFP